MNQTLKLALSHWPHGLLGSEMCKSVSLCGACVRLFMRLFATHQQVFDSMWHRASSLDVAFHYFSCLSGFSTFSWANTNQFHPPRSLEGRSLAVGCEERKLIWAHERTAEADKHTSVAAEPAVCPRSWGCRERMQCSLVATSGRRNKKPAFTTK